MGRNAEGSVKIRLREKAARYFVSVCEKEDIGFTSSETYGLPVMIGFVSKRPMLAVGALMFAVWIIYSTNIVWDIRIDGNTKTSDEEIIAVLDSIGFSVGTYYPSVNLEEISEKYAAVQKDIAWLSIYMDNAVAEVQVRELYRDERPVHEANVYANVVASVTGVIEEVNVFEGQAAVKAGDVVRPGQVLISGVVEKRYGGIRCEYASGEVIARVSVPLEAVIAAERMRMMPTGNEIRGISIKIFKKTLNFFQKGGIVYPSYDKISTMEQLCLFDSIYLPVWIENTVYRETKSTKEIISAEDAAAQAIRELSEKIRAEAMNGELVGKEVSARFEDGVYRIGCLLTLRRDIGEVLEFTVNEPYEERSEGIQ